MSNIIQFPGTTAPPAPEDETRIVNGAEMQAVTLGQAMTLMLHQAINKRNAFDAMSTFGFIIKATNVDTKVWITGRLREMMHSADIAALVALAEKQAKTKPKE
jgi:hypothetical protein